MHKFVIDASIVLEWIEHRETSEKARALETLKQLRRAEIAAYAPQFLLVETLNVLVMKKRLLDEEIEDFLAFVEHSGINIVADVHTQDFTVKLFDNMKKYHITAYDAQYLLSAQKLNCKLISLDRELLKITQWVVAPGA